MFNQCTFIGNLAADPESKFTQSGKQVATFTVCADSGYGDKKTTEFVKCVVWEKLAEIVEKFLRKGSKCMVQGAMKTRSWEDKDGNKRYSTEIIVHEMKMLDGKKDSGQSQGGYEPPPSTGGEVPF